MLRAAVAADAEAIAAIYAPEVLHGTASAEEVPPTPVEMAARMAEVAAAGLPWLVAEEAGVVLGYGYLRPYHPRAAYRFTVENSVYVAAHGRGRGIGGALLAALIEAAGAAAKRAIIASITPQDGAASLALHLRAGFTEVGRLPAIIHKFGRALDCAYLHRAL